MRKDRSDILLDACANLLRDSVDLVADSSPLHSHAPDMVDQWEAHKTILLNAISNFEVELQNYHQWRDTK